MAPSCPRCTGKWKTRRRLKLKNMEATRSSTRKETFCAEVETYNTALRASELSERLGIEIASEFLSGHIISENRQKTAGLFFKSGSRPVRQRLRFNFLDGCPAQRAPHSTKEFKAGCTTFVPPPLARDDMTCYQRIWTTRKSLEFSDNRL